MGKEFKRAFQAMGLILLTLGCFIIGEITAATILISTFLILGKMEDLYGRSNKK